MPRDIEKAGRSIDAAKAGPKMAALLAAAAEPLPEVSYVRLASDGVILIYGRDERAMEAAGLLQDHLDVTVMLLPQARVAPARETDYPVLKGSIRAARGYLGAFEITVDELSQPLPASGATLAYGPARNGAKSRCDILLDLTGRRSLIPTADLRDGYLRADPDDPNGVFEAVSKARDLVGEFDKPLYITFSEGLCAHSRSQLVGCSRCLDLCPTGAIVPAGNHVAIDPHVCAGCGQCAAVCPTGAAAYALPPVDALMRQLRTLMKTYRETGGEDAIVLLHDGAHGSPLIDALERFGNGLPTNVLPFAVNEVTQVGLEMIAAAFAYGASAVRLLQRAQPRHDTGGLERTIALSQSVLAGLGFGDGPVATIATDDPDALGTALRGIATRQPVSRTASFLPMGDKRGILRFALRELHRVALAPIQVLALPEGAPFGKIDIDAAGCTLCLACVSACPTGALTDDPDRPLLRFAEDACVQCGLCKATCPEKVISLTPQLDFAATTASAHVLKEEQPFCCIRCGKAFGVKSTIERIAAKLQDKHWMFKSAPKRLDLVKMCDDCRVAVISESDFDPRGTPRLGVRTRDDYLHEREET